MKKYISILAFAFLLSFAFSVSFGQAQTAISSPSESFEKAVSEGGLIKKDGKLPTVEGSVGTIINSLLGLIGVATFALVVYAGGLWITAAGNEEKVTQARKILLGAVLGLIIIFTAYMIVNFALDTLKRATVVTAPG